LTTWSFWWEKVHLRANRIMKHTQKVKKDLGGILFFWGKLMTSQGFLVDNLIIEVVVVAM